MIKWFLKTGLVRLALCRFRQPNFAVLQNPFAVGNPNARRERAGIPALGLNRKRYPETSNSQLVNFEHTLPQCSRRPRQQLGEFERSIRTVLLEEIHAYADKSQPQVDPPIQTLAIWCGLS